MTTLRGKEIINNGWTAAGVSDAVKLGSSKLTAIDPIQCLIMKVAPVISILSVSDLSAEKFELLYRIRSGITNHDDADDVTDDDNADSEWKEEVL